MVGVFLALGLADVVNIKARHRDGHRGPDRRVDSLLSSSPVVRFLGDLRWWATRSLAAPHRQLGLGEAPPTGDVAATVG